MPETSPATPSPRDAARDRLTSVVRDAQEALIAWVDLRRRQLRIAGVQVCIRVGEEVVVSAALGSADLERGTELTTRHLFRIASHSKTFTATAIMQLREDGLVGLDDRLEEWVQEFEGHPLGSITVRELLGHQAGVVRDGDASDYWQLMEDFPGRERLLEMLTEHGVVLVPNAHFKYTNFGYALLGLVIERASGRSYAEFVRERILDPLGLDRVHPDIDDVPPQECAWGHSMRIDGDDDTFVVGNPSTHALAPATGFVADAEDLSAYAAAHAFGDTRLISDGTQRLMQRPESFIVRRGEEQGRYGLGLVLEKVGKRHTVGHSGGFPGFITRTLLDPTDGLVVCVLTNQAGGPASELAAGLIRLIDLALEKSGPEAASSSAWPEGTPLGMSAQEAREEGIDPASFTGRFLSSWGHTDIRVLGDRLIVFSPDLADPADDAEELRILDADTLVTPAEPGFGAPGERWHATREPSGRITSLRAGGGTLLPEEEFRRVHRSRSARRV